MSAIRRAHEYEYQRPDGSVQIYAGHPRFCMNTEKHKVHLFMYSYRHWDGSISSGSYVCAGEPANYPPRWIDSLE